MPHLVEGRYKQGLAAYRAGHMVRDLINIAEEIDNSADKALDAFRSRAEGGSPEDDAAREALHRERIDGLPSLVAGFADGLIDDIRNLARSTPLQRRGVSA